MRNLTSLPQQDQFHKGVWISVGLHVGLFLLFTAKLAFFPSTDIDYQSAVRVDLVALPDKYNQTTLPPDAFDPKIPEATKTTDTQEKLEPEVKPKDSAVTKPTPAPSPKHDLAKKIEADKDAISLSKVKDKQKDALKKLKALEALEKIKNEVSKENAMAIGKKAQAGQIKVKGNIISAGASLTGVHKLDYDDYIGSLDRHIKYHWTLPQWLANKNYKARIRIKIDEKGRLISKDVVVSSGSRDYDEFALSTIDKSDPFPPPVEKFIAKAGIEGIVIGFPE